MLDFSATCSDILHTEDSVSCTNYCIEKFYDKSNRETVAKGRRLANIIANSPKEVLYHDYFVKNTNETFSVKRYSGELGG